ncbi:helix-turn-helix domain-containing protein [Enterococcus nangangensis]|uniref:helix-turn-helix domain-containing protein n=1 Tax=Enterococcus nangangensis TaxID=2559926 RepID=UPI0010F55595|nr:helix-turn-helix domain-containing protein [Enterococcus nangangensis]
MQIGAKLKQERKKAGLSQQQLADHLLITRQAISNWENEKSQPDIDTLIKICDYYQIPLSSLTSSDNSPTTEKDENIENTLSSTFQQQEPTDAKELQNKIYKKMTPFILLLCVIMTLIALLPAKVKVPFLFFFSLGIIFLLVALFIYYIVKHFFEQQ